MSSKPSLFCPPKTLSLLIGFMLSVFFVSLNHAQSITLNGQNMSVKQALEQIRHQSGMYVMYENRLVESSPSISLDLNNVSLQTALQDICSQAKLHFEIQNEHILITDVNAKSQNAPQYVLQGKVTDEENNPLPGTTILVKGQSRGAVTDLDGMFNITVRKGYVLIFSYIGMKEQEITITNQQRLDIIMQHDVNVLQEVEVVSTGYQTISRERNTAAVAQVSNTQLNKQLNTDLLAALEGQVAGLNYVKNPTGTSADSPIIRGVGTFSSNVGTAPLIVVDDLPTELTLEQLNPYDVETITVLKDAAALSIYGARAANGVIVVTTKQAKGKGTQVSINADWFMTLKPDMDRMHYASTSELIDYETDVYNAMLGRYNNDVNSLFNYYGSIGTGTIRYYSPLFQLYRDQAEGTISATEVQNTLSQWRDNDYIRDFSKNVWRPSITQRYNVSLSHNAEKSNTYFSFNYEKNDERVIHNQNERFNSYYKSIFDVKKWLKATVGVNLSYSINQAGEGLYDNYLLQPRYARITGTDGYGTANDYVNLGFGSGNAVNAVVAEEIAANPNLKSVGFNLLESMAESITKTNTLNLRPFVNVQIRLHENLDYQAMFQYEIANAEQKLYDDANSYKMRMLHNSLVSYNSTTGAYTSNLPAGGRFYQLNRNRNNYTFRQQLNFDRTFAKDFSVTAIGGFEMRQTRTPRTIEELRYGYDPVTLTSTIIDWIGLSQTGYTSYVYGSRATLSGQSRVQSEILHRYISVYGNTGLNYLGKYSLTGSIRVDQADLFGVDPKYRYRPLWSVGAGWNVSNEEFMKDLTWVNRLKVRATYGINGNVDQTSSPYLIATRRNDNLYTSLQYLNISTLPNPKLRWEKTQTANLGVDFALFGNRLDGSIDLYNRYSSDLLVTTELDPTVGASSRVLNNGAMRNKGIEIALGSELYRDNDWSVSVRLVAASNKNTVEKLNFRTTSAYSYVGAPANYFFLDQPYNSLYAYRFSRMVNGYPVFLDENGDENIDFDANGNPTSVRNINSVDAIVRKGNLLPTYNGSFTFRARYKFLELSSMLVFSGGNHLRKDVTSLSSYDVYDEDIAQRWTSNGTSDLPRLYVDYPLAMTSYASTLSTLWQYADVQVKKADYVKLRNIAVSVHLPDEILKKAGFGPTKVTLQANNLWTWAAAGDGIDPEAYSLNSGTRQLPVATSFLIGFSTNF
ncbi:MAG: SusC/RagA family TonB-linked outer membrane protein [Capnocytophaga sp.]|nr:SusC/RagA family TonB-linked outer membrane protein [Capnocytophaga sp.]